MRWVSDSPPRGGLMRSRYVPACTVMTSPGLRELGGALNRAQRCRVGSAIGVIAVHRHVKLGGVHRRGHGRRGQERERGDSHDLVLNLAGSLDGVSRSANSVNHIVSCCDPRANVALADDS